MNRNYFFVFAAAFCLVFFGQSASAFGQVTIQLPTFRVFNARTVVSVPDGGSLQIGGVNRHSSGRVSRGLPGGGRLLGNRGIGGNTGSSRATVHPRLIIMSELEAEVLAKAARLQKKAAAKDPNGAQAVQSKADFITRNIGRTNKR